MSDLPEVAHVEVAVVVVGGGLGVRSLATLTVADYSCRMQPPSPPFKAPMACFQLNSRISPSEWYPSPKYCPSSQTVACQLPLPATPPSPTPTCETLQAPKPSLDGGTPGGTYQLDLQVKTQ